MIEILGPEWFSEDPETRKRLYSEHYVGRYHTNWDTLRWGAASTFLAAARQFGEWLEWWRRMTTKDQPRAETAVVLEMNYQGFVFGPLLSTVLLAAFSFESLVRLCAEIMLLERAADSDMLRLALGGFDRGTAAERLEAALELVGAGPLPKECAVMVQGLVEFRNGCAHDAPLLFAPTGDLIHAKAGRLRVVDESNLYRGLYPPLHSAVVSLTTKHARQAVQTHDAVVQHLAQKAGSEFHNSYKRLYLGSTVSPIQHHLPSTLQGAVIDNQIEVWESEVAPWLAAIPKSEKEEFYRRTVRRAVIRKHP